jgi:hypothetical protein
MKVEGCMTVAVFADAHIAGATSQPASTFKTPTTDFGALSAILENARVRSR